MNIITEGGDGVVTLEVEGRVDAITNPVLQGAILNVFMKTGSLVPDFAQVEYTSNAGLRVLLIREKVVKRKGGFMKLTHVAALVMGALKVTGFLEILYIK